MKILLQDAKKLTKEIVSVTTQIIKKNILLVITFMILLAFAIPILVLYYLYPSTFLPTWTGTWERRVYYLFFLWLFSLETILNWEELQLKQFRLHSTRTIAIIVALCLPMIYVIVANFFGLNNLIVNIAKENGIQKDWADLMPLSTEYLVFAVFFAFIVVLLQGRRGLKDYSLSTFFLVIMGTIYMINNVYPFGKFTPFQILVHPTALLAANILSLMGYRTYMSFTYNDPTFGSLTNLGIRNAQGDYVAFGIAWPCAGVESLMLYTITILLFLKKSPIPLAHKIIYFIIGAVVTYFINVLRIVTIYVIAINKGDWGIFHDYYGQLYSIIWIISYPLIIVGTRNLWSIIRSWRLERKESSSLPNKI